MQDLHVPQAKFTTELPNEHLLAWIARLEGLSPTAQCVGLRLAAQADEVGYVENIDWYSLAESCGVTERTAKAALRDGDLITFDAVERIERSAGRQSISPAFQLNLWEE